MNIDTLIAKLLLLRKEHGNLRVCVSDSMDHGSLAPVGAPKVTIALAFPGHPNQFYAKSSIRKYGNLPRWELSTQLALETQPDKKVIVL